LLSVIGSNRPVPAWAGDVALLDRGGFGPALVSGADVLPGGLLHGLDNIVIPGAAANISFQAVADLFFARIGVLAEQVGRRHNHPRRAITALQAVLLAEGLLHGRELAPLSQPLNRGDFAPVDLDREHGAGLDGLVVHPDRAGAALAAV